MEIKLFEEKIKSLGLDNLRIESDNEIQDWLKVVESEFKIYHPKYYKENHIFDENQSVKWNREEVVKRNNQEQSLFHVSREQFYIARERITTAVYDWFLRDCATIKTIDQAQLVVDRIIREFDGLTCNRFEEILDIINIAGNPREDF